MPRPEPDETYEDYIDRCTGEGHSEGQCEVWWDEEARADAPAPVLRYRRVLTAFYGAPWAILPEKLAEIRAFLLLAANSGGKGEFDTAEVKARMDGREPSSVAMAGRVAVLPVFGTIAQRAGMLEDASGGASCEAIGAALDNCVADKSCKAIVLAFDSPGGAVYGVPELAAKIYRARAEKKVVAVADSMAASAAYWLASQCEEVNVTPGGQVGSIGVLAAHEDMSGHLEKQGVKTTMITSGKFKGEGNPFGPLSEEDRTAKQEMCDAYYGQFVGAVAKGRGVSEAAVRNGYGQGRLLNARAARAAGLVDHVATLEQVLTRLGAPASAAGGGRASEDLRRRLDLEMLD